jgi:hypothetical protein
MCCKNILIKSLFRITQLKQCFKDAQLVVLKYSTIIFLRKQRFLLFITNCHIAETDRYYHVY